MQNYDIIYPSHNTLTLSTETRVLHFSQLHMTTLGQNMNNDNLVVGPFNKDM